MSWEYKQKILVLIMNIVQLSNKVHEYGILSLDEVYPSLRPDFLSKAIHYLVEGFNENELKTMLDFEIHSLESSEAERLEKQLIKEGVLLILSGEHGKSLFEKILFMLEDEFFDGMDETQWHQEEGDPIKCRKSI